jgi:hypothetical protein
MPRRLLLAGLVFGGASRAEDGSAARLPLLSYADLPWAARWPCAFVGELIAPASGLGAHPFGGDAPLRVPADLRAVASAAVLDEVLRPQFMELCTQVRGSLTPSIPGQLP